MPDEFAAPAPAADPLGDHAQATYFDPYARDAAVAQSAVRLPVTPGGDEEDPRAPATLLVQGGQPLEPERGTP